MRSSREAERAAAARDDAPRERLRIDHILLGIGDIERGINELEQATGVRAVHGGAHPGRGTQNALVSLGPGQYLEVIAPNPLDTAGATRASRLESLGSLTPVGWAVRVDDIGALRTTLVARGVHVGDVQEGSRVRPDGSRLAWRTLAVVAPAHELLPFFIEWGTGSPHPSLTSPPGCTLASFRLEDPAPDTLQAALRMLGLPVVVSRGGQPRIVLALACPKGAVELR